jgi:glycosyltransferase involved in cell wall biosynthesis
MPAEDDLRLALQQRDAAVRRARDLEASLDREASRARAERESAQRQVMALEARLEELGRASAAKLEEAQGENRKLASDVRVLTVEHRRLAARIREMDAELLARDERLKGVRRSLSWRITAPLRDLQGFFGRKAEEAPTQARRAESTEEAPGEAPAPELAEAAGAQPSPGERRHTYHIDHPRVWSTESRKLLVLGWCFENSALPITGFRARYDGKVFEGSYGAKRLDVLASTHRKQGEFSGLKLELDTQLGDYPLALEVRHEDGWHPFFQTVLRTVEDAEHPDLNDHERWCLQNEALGDADLAAIRGHIAALRGRPVFSLLMAVSGTPEDLLAGAVGSVERQLYPHWELCIAADASCTPGVRAILDDHQARDPRIRVRPVETGGPCKAAGAALEWATGSHVALIGPEDTLSPTCLYEVAAKIDAHPDAQWIYSDEDAIDLEGRRSDPYFKPDWNPDLAFGQDFTGRLCVYPAALVRSTGAFGQGLEEVLDWDLALRVSERIPSSAIRHIPRLLYHRRATPESVALRSTERQYPSEAARTALADHFKRTGETVEIVPVPGGLWRVKFAIPSPPPLVSILIPTRNAMQLVRQAVQSILSRTDYPNFEIVIVDNASDDPEALAYFESLTKGENSRVRVVRYAAPFNYSAINNFAVTQAAGQVVVLLNSDIEVISVDWLTEMVSLAMRPGVGAVGAMLYYPNNTVQHAGVVLGLGGVAGHPYKDFPRGAQGQRGRLRLVQGYSAVTGACLLVRKDLYLSAGCLNEKDLAIAFNDVDLCLKLTRLGYRSLWTPHAELYHHESATRGIDNTPEKLARFQSELDYMLNTWGEALVTDPAYNPNLTLVREDFSAAYISRVGRAWAGYLQHAAAG